MDNAVYTSNLVSGSGLVEESLRLLDHWDCSMDRAELHFSARNSGVLCRLTDRSLKDIVYRQFAPRFLAGFGPPAKWLSLLLDAGVSGGRLLPVLFLQTARANPMLFDYVVDLYWFIYFKSGASAMTVDDAVAFINDAVDLGKTGSRWSEELIRKVAVSLNRTLADFGFLEGGKSASRAIMAPRIPIFAANYLAHELHFSGKNDDGVLGAREWSLWGMDRRDVVEVLNDLSREGHFIVQDSGQLMRISWKHKTMEDFIRSLIDQNFEHRQ